MAKYALVYRSRSLQCCVKPDILSCNGCITMWCPSLIKIDDPNTIYYWLHSTGMELPRPAVEPTLTEWMWRLLSPLIQTFFTKGASSVVKMACVLPHIHRVIRLSNIFEQRWNWAERRWFLGNSASEVFFLSGYSSWARVNKYCSHYLREGWVISLVRPHKKASEFPAKLRPPHLLVSCMSNWF